MGGVKAVTFMRSRLFEPSKARSPILSIPAPIVIDFKSLPLNALVLISFTLDGIIKSVIPLLEKA